MQFLPTTIRGVYVVEPVLAEDERGFFARTWDRSALLAAGLDADLDLTAITFNIRRGTLRGMHYQASPHAETKLVRVTKGSIYDVAVDLRVNSPTFLQWYGHQLTAENRSGLYIPKGCAHGYLTLQDDTELTYCISAAYSPESARGVRYDDPAFNIDWPAEVTTIAPRDANYPDFK